MKKELFAKAHSIARNLQMINKDATYRSLFAEALRRAWASIKSVADEAKQAQMPVRQIYLAVPYGDKDKAKKAGAKWDAVARSWYVIASAVPSALARWENSIHNSKTLSTADYV